MLSHQVFVLVSSRIIQIMHVFDRVIVIFVKCGGRQQCLRRLFGFWGISHYPLPITAWTCDRTRRQPATAIKGHQYNYDFGFLWIARSAILVVPHTQNIAVEKISGFERKAFTRQNFPDSNVFGFKVPTLDSGFKISGDMTKPGCFHIGFVLLCVNAKTDPVLKRSGFITNPEQFPLV